MDPLRIAIIGFGQIARTRHLPVIAAGGDFRLVAVASDGPFDAPDGCRHFANHRALLDADGFDAVAICTPPRPRARIAADALRAGKHVLLEKPAAATLGELAQLSVLAAQQRRSLLAAWHSQFSLAVNETKRLLGGRRIVRLRAIWHENVERWHAGQSWIWEAGGFGVFDAGSNALSILTRIAPESFIIESSDFLIATGRTMPIAARLELSNGDEGSFSVDLDWRAEVDSREIEIEGDDGTVLRLTNSGRHLHVDGRPAVTEDNLEYSRLYAHFRQLIDQNASDVDAEPLRLIADAFLVASSRAA
jgi:D-galactose 1-dehydrogenase